MVRDEAEICVCVNIKSGFAMGFFVVRVLDSRGVQIYEKIITDEKYSFDKIAEYINKKFVNSKRFENLRALYRESNGNFEYYGIDTKRVIEAQSEKWEDVGAECPWYKAPAD